MPIMAAQGRSDARGTARLLASMALASIDNPSAGESQEVALNNMYRLLQSFRKDAFFGQEISSGEQAQTDPNRLTLRPPIERNVREVREALDQATQTAFGGQPRDQAIETVENVLRAIAYPTVAELPAPEVKARVVSFFQALVERL
ncbi:hypothetical protein ACNJYA_00645 [Bradyrhizobium sp. DASA03068]|uniref:hypothetical protein n=1 Tax=Bradyrhizobium sp. BLXBL-01 TaxID=3395915 RepID=UPI003F6F0B2E